MWTERHTRDSKLHRFCAEAGPSGHLIARALLWSDFFHRLDFHFFLSGREQRSYVYRTTGVFLLNQKVVITWQFDPDSSLILWLIIRVRRSDESFSICFRFYSLQIHYLRACTSERFEEVESLATEIERERAFNTYYIYQITRQKVCRTQSVYSSFAIDRNEPRASVILSSVENTISIREQGSRQISSKTSPRELSFY